jgi:chaperonin GroEL (HSP60 family)
MFFIDSLREPILLLAKNAGLNGQIILRNVLLSEDFCYGYDLKTSTSKIYLLVRHLRKYD